jgi:hypothetical protein
MSLDLITFWAHLAQEEPQSLCSGLDNLVGLSSPGFPRVFRITGLDKLLADGLLESGKYPSIDNSIIGARQGRQE